MATYSEAKPAGRPTWIDLMTPDIDAARAFYHTVFGWEYDIGSPEFGGYTTARVGDLAAAGLAGPQPGTPPMPAAWSLYFATDNIEADVARAVELGAKVMYPAMTVGEFGSMATCEDPTGAAFSFWQAGQHVGTQITDEPGSAAWYELYSPDAKRARDFYMALLRATADPMPGDMEYYVLKHGETMFGGIMQIDPAWGGFAPQWTTYFTVTNTDAALAAITGNGGKALSNVDDSPFGRLAAVMDPGGATFKIIQPPAR
ncbi:VOC family protein [Chloroflexales bacterium ZM16-3]|nr:VOC family protein [Chloroflexales bacterium ZM16-3]